MDGSPDSQDRVHTTPGRARGVLKRIEGHVVRRIGSGLLILIPLIVTVLIIRFIIVSVDELFRGEDGFFTRLIKDTPLDFPAVGIVFLVPVLYLVGLLVSGRVGSMVIAVEGAVLTRIPVIKSIYGVVRQITETLSSPSDQHFSRVVFVEWPRPGCRALGFVTGHSHAAVEEEMFLVIYIPTVPNPTSGNLAFVPEKDVIESNMTVEEAMKLVFSGGIVLPSAFTRRT